MGTVITNSNGDFVVDEFNRTFSLEDIPDASGISIPDHSILFQFSDMSFDPRTVEKYNQNRWSRVSIEGYNLWYWRNTNTLWDFAPFGQSDYNWSSGMSEYVFASLTPPDRLSESPYRVLKITDMTGVLRAEALFAHCHHLTEILCDIEFPDIQLQIQSIRSGTATYLAYFKQALDFCVCLRKCGDFRLYSNDNATEKSSFGNTSIHPLDLVRISSPLLDRIPDFYFTHLTTYSFRPENFIVRVDYPYLLNKGGKCFFADANAEYSITTGLTAFQINPSSSNSNYIFGGWSLRTPSRNLDSSIDTGSFVTDGGAMGPSPYEYSTILGYDPYGKSPYDKLFRTLPLRFVNNSLVEHGREISCAPFSAYKGPATEWPRFYYSGGTSHSTWPYNYPPIYTGCPFIKELETNFVNYTNRDGSQTDTACVFNGLFYGCFGAENVVESVTDFDTKIGANRSSGISRMYVSAGISTSAGRYDLRVNVPTKYGGGSTQYLRNNLGSLTDLAYAQTLGAHSNGLGMLVFPSVLATPANNRVLDFYYQLMSSSSYTRPSNVVISMSDFEGYGEYAGKTGADESKLYVRVIIHQIYSGWKMYSNTPIWEITNNINLADTRGKWFTTITPPAFDTAEGTFDPMETVCMDIVGRPTDDVDIDNGYGLKPATSGNERFSTFYNDWNIRYDLTQLD